MIRYVATIALSVFVAGCHPPRAGVSGATTQPTIERFSDTFGLAQWQYITRDTEGTTLTEGLLTLPNPLQDGVRFQGSWQARYVGPLDQQDKIGRQTNGGKLAGETTSGIVTLELNPGMANHNVSFRGEMENDRLIGTWEYSNDAGPAANGTFEALLLK